jgi:diguanylate cyclase (GGDEF)-like protein
VDQVHRVGAAWRDRVTATWRACTASVWHADLTDQVVLARIRARVLWVSSLLGMVAVLSAAAWGNAASGSARPTQLIIAGLLLVTFAVAAVRGSRLGDLQFLFLLILSLGFAAVGVYVAQGAGKVSQTVVSMLSTIIFAALFCARRRHVVLYTLMGIALLVGVAATADFDDQITIDLYAGVFSVVVVTAVVRLLRDLAVTAVARAGRGEVTDPLTGLFNRRGFERAGGRRWLDHAREQLPVAMLVLDVDHFKQINDTQGHAAGDQILQRLAEVISRTIRADDIAVRLGGEEFLVLSSVQPGFAVPLAERLRVAVAEELAPVTISIGVHETVPGTDDQQTTALWQAVGVADKAMYVAKSSGRNRVVSSAQNP